jgi:sporulation-control protein spo0M
MTDAAQMWTEVSAELRGFRNYLESTNNVDDIHIRILNMLIAQNCYRAAMEA